MGLMYKQLTKELLRNRIFVFLLLIMTVFASFMYFFVRFSIDANMAALKTIDILSPNETLYMNALNSNTILAFNFLIVLTALAGFVYGLFYYRFFRKNKKQVGCLKALGFKDRTLSAFFVIFSAVLSLIGAAIGLAGGYFASSVLIDANTRSYSMSGLVKGIDPVNVAIGFLSVTVVSSIVTLAVYGLVRGKEIAALISGTDNTAKDSSFLRFVGEFVEALPVKNKFPLRIALRKPVAVIIIVLAVMGFSVMFIIGYSVNLSSGKVYKSQTEGHLYLYDTRYDQYQAQKELPKESQSYLSVPGTLSKKINRDAIPQNIVGLESNKELLQLSDSKGTQLGTLPENGIYISPALREMYGFQKGDTVKAAIDGVEYTLVVSDIAVNATSGCVYMDKNILTELLGIPAGAYNGIMSMNPLKDGGTVTTYEQKLAALERASVSNQNSGIINQVTGVLAGCILIFLALLLNFQDSTRDILILNIMGYRAKAIRKMLIDIYKPILWISFLLTLWPSILVAQAVQKSLSIQTEDYMPFGTSWLVILAVFVLLNAIYFLVQAMFNMGIRRVVAREEISEYTSAE